MIFIIKDFSGKYLTNFIKSDIIYNVDCNE